MTHGEVNVDPKLLNRDGFRFLFKESYVSYWVVLHEKDGEYLPGWGFPEVDRSNENDLLFIRFMGDPLEYDTEYEIVISVHNDDCERIEIVIQFRTKPRKTVLQETPTAIQ